MRHRMAMVDVPELFRVRLTLQGPDGYRREWYEGPWPKDKSCAERIAYWNGHYRATRGDAWRVTGVYERAEVTWVPMY